MKWLKYLMLVVALAMGSGSALAHGRGHFGVFVDVPLWPLYYPGPYYHGYYYPPTVVAVPAAAPVYVEQSPAAAPVQAPVAASYWYHCNKPEGYYPYVKECVGGWQKVVPQAPPGQ